MRLSTITEQTGGRAVIRRSAEALGDFIRFVYDQGAPEHRKALDQFLQNPNPRAWDKTSWLLGAAQQMVGPDPQMVDSLKKWEELKGLTSPTIVAAIYDIEPAQAKGTPLQGLIMAKSTRDKYKMAMGPQGYVSTMANAGQLGTHRLRHMLKDTAKSGAALAKAAKRDIPGVRTVPKF